MNIGADALTPSRRSWITCPSSCRKRSTTKPTANGKPQISAYAPIETKAEPKEVNTFSFGSRNSRDFAFRATSATAASAAPSRLRPPVRSGRPEPGWIGS